MTAFHGTHDGGPLDGGQSFSPKAFTLFIAKLLYAADETKHRMREGSTSESSSGPESPISLAAGAVATTRQRRPLGRPTPAAFAKPESARIKDGKILANAGQFLEQNQYGLVGELCRCKGRQRKATPAHQSTLSGGERVPGPALQAGRYAAQGHRSEANRATPRTAAQ